MMRIRRALVPVLALVLGAAIVAAAQGQATEGARRGPGGGQSRGSLLGLLRLEQVQKELKLTEEQVAKVGKIGEDLSAEMREQSAALREIEDQEKRRAKTTELRDQFDRKAREKLQDVLAREQMTRLDQIRTQARPVVDSLNDTYVAGRLKLTEDQKKKLAGISKNVQAKQSEMFASMRDASQEQRQEARQKRQKIRSDADKEALGVLTAEQAKAFQEMQGKKIELQMRRG